MKKILKQSWLWYIVIGVAIGFYTGYNVGQARGYEKAMTVLYKLVDDGSFLRGSR